MPDWRTSSREKTINDAAIGAIEQGTDPWHHPQRPILCTAAHPFQKDSEVAGFEARMIIDRLAYNVGNGKFYDMGVVGKDVAVLITLEVMRKK